MTVYENGFYMVIKMQFYGNIRFLVKRIDEDGIEEVCETLNDAIWRCDHYSDIDW